MNEVKAEFQTHRLMKTVNLSDNWFPTRKQMRKCFFLKRNWQILYLSFL